MDTADVGLRNLTYRLFVEAGAAPTAGEVAAEAQVTKNEVERCWRRLAQAHALVLREGTTELLMANPFSAVPTPYRVEAAGRWWYANCAWDAFGVCAALHADGRIETTCPDCDAPLSIRLDGQLPDDNSFVFHCLVPAALWWDNIVFT